MFSQKATAQRLSQARDLVREKGLSRQDLELLDEIIRVGMGDLVPLLEPAPAPRTTLPESAHMARLRRSFGLFLAFLNQFSDRRLGEMRTAMGLVLQHSLAGLEEMACAAHHDILYWDQAPEWVVDLLDLAASLRAVSTALGTEAGTGMYAHWSSFLLESREQFRTIFQMLAGREDGPALVARLNQQMKTLNRALQTESGRPVESIRRLESLLESAVPEDTRVRTEPLLLVQHVISSLRMTLSRPLDRGVHWPAVEHVRGSLQWLWNHLGWTLPRVEAGMLEEGIPPEVRGLLQELRRGHPGAFRIVARALASHLALLSLVERMEPAVNTSIQERFSLVPTFFLIENELGRLASHVYNPAAAEQLPEGSEEGLLLGAFLRQAVLSLLQDQATLHGLLQQALANNDPDQLAHTLDNLRALLLSHQRLLMADLVGLFSPELRQRLFPDSPSLTEEGDRLRRRLHRLWEHLDPAFTQIQLHQELKDWPRLALAVAQAQNQLAAFLRSPEFLLIRSQDRQEIERLTQNLGRALNHPEDIFPALQEGAELVGELLRFLEVFLLRINARVPLIRLDLTTAREAHQLCIQLLDLPRSAPDRLRQTHKLIQTTKPLGVRDPQSLSLLKRWVRSERSDKDIRGALEVLASHLERLAARLDAALS